MNHCSDHGSASLPSTVVSAAEYEAAMLSGAYTRYVREDLRRDPVDALHDAEMLLAESQRCMALLTDPALRYVQGERLRRMYLSLPDHSMIAVAECLVNYHKARVASALAEAASEDSHVG
ncbi:hypothetical protein [Castellaniella sp. UC4442_H9]